MPKRLYKVNSIFGPTIQGEGAMTGTPTFFIRFSMCNMWNGKPETKAESRCPYCDTDFLKYQEMTAHEIVHAMQALRGNMGIQWVTVSGGEPLIQYDDHLAYALKGAGFLIAIETNGTMPLDAYANHVSMSPKRPRKEIKLASCDTIKILWPPHNPEITPEAFADYPAVNKYLQPMSMDHKPSLQKIYELGHPWKLSPQIHKMIDVV